MTGIPVLPPASPPKYGYANPERVQRYGKTWYDAYALLEELEALHEGWPNVYDPDDAVADCLIPDWEPDEEDLVRLREFEVELSKVIHRARYLRGEIEKRIPTQR